MSSDYFSNVAALIAGLITIGLFGLNTASSEGAGWGSLESASAD
ncbi:hypothetical protein ACIQYW_02855 [Rhodococcus erythropolis]|jgi:hypothetical protein|uniref:Uncharacterized protein n=1 Tax=Rhodococcus baikonurensis TaxID=172041 RepID=A0ABV5XHA1_9NOCA|nr:MULTISPECIES: hypothetical protein [Rhodococcus]MCQ4123195.1 hypothetical protein [Rhodococcus erythropolis]MDJ0011502.1 hypothetical protein [Rhodococcus erythropolis]MDJ0107930.1 hypothetical protein [Rhodococcus erythropolis]MDV8010609.1 hypothetical protein [Rhodococcus sp. IEGM 1241]